MKISLQSTDRFFEAKLQYLVKEKEQIIVASYVGVPEAVTAITAGIIEGRPVRVNNEDFVRGHDTFRRVERKIGLGDVAHGIVFNSLTTLDGLSELIESEKNNRGYIVSLKGQIKEDISHYVISRFGLPPEWSEHYSGLFGFMLDELEVIQNPAFQHLLPDLRAFRFNGNETDVLDVIEMALKNRLLTIPQSDIEGVFDPNWSLKEYMVNNAVAMNKKLSVMRPLHTMRDKLDPAIATMNRVPFPAQAHVIQGLVNGLDVENSVITSANMGTGKSIQAVGVSHVLNERKKRRGAKKGTPVLLSAPGITLRKWEAKEILKTIPHAKTTIIRSSEQALKLLKDVRNGYRPNPGEIEFTIVGIDKAKRDSEPFFAGVWKRLKGSHNLFGWHCPDCGRQLYKKEEGEWFPLEWSDVAFGEAPSMDHLQEARETKTLLPNGLPKSWKVKWNKTKQFSKCSYREGVQGYLPDNELPCGTKLFRPAVKSRGETIRRPVANISRIFKKMKKYFDLYIVDEVHQCKASGSGRGDAFTQMVKAAKKTLMLTGTLVNGKSTSIKEILWRTNPQALLEKGMDDNTGDLAWAERYGKVKQVVYLEDEINQQGWVTRQRRKPMQPTEEPGIAPHMTAEFLLHKTAFLDLEDLGLPLVELKEKPIFITMTPEHGTAYEEFHENMYQECAKRARAGAKGAWSKFNPATLNYAARPDLGAFYRFVNMDGKETIISAPKLTGYTAKEEWLIETVKNELSENRGVVIYNSYTGEYQLNERIQTILNENGIPSTILNESNTEKRSEVIQQYEDQGIKVVICNMKLVEVGLDLLAWPTLIFNRVRCSQTILTEM